MLNLDLLNVMVIFLYLTVFCAILKLKLYFLSVLFITEVEFTLTGCFTRAEKFTFLNEYKGSEDVAVCGNDTGKSYKFQEAAKAAVAQAVVDATNNYNYA